MSTYIVRDADLGLKFRRELQSIQIDVSADFGLVGQNLQRQLELEDGSKSRKKRKLSPLSSTRETFNLRFLHYGSPLIITAYGPALQKFVDAHKSMKLGMNFDATFENGVKLTCEMRMRGAFHRYPHLQPQRHFYGSVDYEAQAQSTKMFENDQLNTAKYSLEVISQKQLEIFEFADTRMSEARLMFKGFLEEDKYSDFTIVAENDVRIPCHKVFLGARSPVLDRMLQMDCKETRENCVKFQASEEGVKAFLKYVYYGRLEDAFDSPIIATELLDLAHVYDIKELMEAVKKLFMRRPDDWLDMDAALNLFLSTLGKDGLENLKARALQIIKSRKDELDQSSVFQEFQKRNPTEFFKLFL